MTDIRIIVEGNITETDINRLVDRINEAISDHDVIEIRRLNWFQKLVEWFKA